MNSRTFVFVLGVVGLGLIGWVGYQFLFPPHAATNSTTHTFTQSQGEKNAPSATPLSSPLSSSPGTPKQDQATPLPPENPSPENPISTATESPSSQLPPSNPSGFFDSLRLWLQPTDSTFPFTKTQGRLALFEGSSPYADIKALLEKETTTLKILPGENWIQTTYLTLAAQTLQHPSDIPFWTKQGVDELPQVNAESLSPSQASLLEKIACALATNSDSPASPEQKEQVIKSLFLSLSSSSCLADLSFLKGKEYLNAGEDYLARRALSLALQKTQRSPEEITWIKKTLTQLNEKLVFSPFPTPDSIEYTVQPGDSLWKIAKEQGVAVGQLKRVNQFTSRVIYPNQRLKIIKGPFRIFVSKKNLTLTLYLGLDFIKEYPISIGDPVKNPTPVGAFTIVSKVIDPPWKNIPYGDPHNILGTRWMGFQDPYRSYGIHGTTDPATIGKRLTAGCVRMQNSDVEEVYDFVPYGTPVTIHD